MGTSSQKILIVDDQPFIRKSLGILLRHLEPEIYEAGDGQEALDLARNGTPMDLIITDHDMPVMDGITFCREVKKDQKLRGIPIIMVSQFDGDEHVEKALNAGAAAHISKSDAHDEFTDCVERLLCRSAFVQNKKILVVEDSPVVLTMVARHLLQNGFQVLRAENGVEAWRILREEQVDLILSDIEMPEMDGYTLCEAVKGDAELHAIPFVAMSSIEGKRHVRKIIQKGADAYLAQPFNMDELSIIVERILSDQFKLLLSEKEYMTLERNLLLGSITSLVSALEARDKYTRGHSDSVAAIVRGMAELYGVDDVDPDTLAIGAKLHDIGKIGVSDLILRKQGRLSEEEFEQIQQHPEEGARILKAIPSLKKVIPIVMHHHERYDGNGYPHCLAKEEIPFWARVTAVADTYDAMISDRPYRAGLGTDKVLQIIKEVSGTQLCPECVDLFLRWHALQGQEGFREVL